MKRFYHWDNVGNLGPPGQIEATSKTVDDAFALNTDFFVYLLTYDQN